MANGSVVNSLKQDPAGPLNAERPESPSRAVPGAITVTSPCDPNLAERSPIATSCNPANYSAFRKENASTYKADPVETVRARLEALGYKPRPVQGNPNQFSAFCPCPNCHPRKPKLSFGLNRNGDCGIKCHHKISHSVEEILQATGLTYADLFTERHNPTPDLYELLARYDCGALKPICPGYVQRLPEDAPADTYAVAELMDLQHGLRMAVGDFRELPFAIVPNAQRLGWDNTADKGRKRMWRALQWLLGDEGKTRKKNSYAVIKFVKELPRLNKAYHYGTYCYSPAGEIPTRPRDACTERQTLTTRRRCSYAKRTKSPATTAPRPLGKRTVPPSQTLRPATTSNLLPLAPNASETEPCPCGCSISEHAKRLVWLRSLHPALHPETFERAK